MTKGKGRPRRATSNIFAMLDQSQIHEFKEAFNIIDQNRDGYIDSEDLREMLSSLGEWFQFQYEVYHAVFRYVMCTKFSRLIRPMKFFRSKLESDWSKLYSV